LPFKPYMARGSQQLLERIGKDMIRGNTLTSPGFYAPQGRQVRAALRLPNLVEALSRFRYQDKRLTNFEMETAAMYGFAKMMGHRAVSCNALIANRQLQTFSKDPHKTIETLIELVLEKLAG